MNVLENTLEKIQFTSENGLLFCNRLNEARHISEHYYIQEKGRDEEFKPTAILFRRKYEQDRVINSKPVLYVYEKENSFFNSDEHKKLHAKIWSAGEIELYFIVSNTRIDIVNARRPAEIQDNKLDVQNLRLVSEAIEQFNDQRFSAIVFGKGTFWEQEDFYHPQKDNNFYNNQLKEEDTPFHQLLEYLMIVRKHLHDNQKHFSPETIDKLLIVSILIKFLEEIKDDHGTHTLREIYKKHLIENFAMALETGKCLSILNALGSEFKPDNNGNIFDNFSDEERGKIAETEFPLVAQFLRAALNLSTGQYFLWEQYSFNYLPVELISAIYERFLSREERGIVYTPPFLVNFLIDEVVPLDRAELYFSQNKFKVLDPSCGSGIFLVATYKRMLEWWSINDYYENERTLFKLPNKEICQKILQDNIFGVDIKDTATLITVFSLTITLLDKLEPKEIWNNLKLDGLQNNIQTKNFFEWATTAKNDNKKFDLVIGNPPFNPISGKIKINAVSEEQIEQFGIRGKDIPDNNFALKFFEGAMFFGQHVCLILPSSILLYNKSKLAQKYRTRIFTRFTIGKVLDFTHLRRSLFGNVDIPVCAISAISTESQKNPIEHIVVKRLSSIEKKIYFEIDHYDYHSIPHNWVIDPSKQFIWKTNLLGGGRLFHLIYRLSLLPTLKAFILHKVQTSGKWAYNVGYRVKHSKKEKITADFITGKPTIKPKSFRYDGDFDIEIETSKLFVEIRTEELYKPPHIIFKLVLEKSSIPMAFSDEYLCFNRSFVGIHAPLSDRDELYKIYDRLHKNEMTSRLYQTFILATSPKTMVYHETSMVKNDIDDVPYPNETEYLMLSPTEKILIDDIWKYYIHLGKSISKRGAGSKLQEKANQEQLEQFGQIFCDALNPIYAKHGKSWQCGTFYQTESFTVCQFGYGKDDGLSLQTVEGLDDTIKPMIYNTESNRGAIFTRVCRIYKHLNGYDCVFLIKPHATRYWLGSIALRDADETFMDLKKAGR